MACNHPLKAFWTGNYTDKGKKEYIIAKGNCELLSFEYAEKKKFRINRALAPYITENGHQYLIEPLTIPCGTCLACKLSKSKEWTNRVCVEGLYYKYKYFLTLTYDDYHLPVDGELSKRDIVLWIKRLRKYINFRYFLSGEYGEGIVSTHRPHYHIIILTNERLDVKPSIGANSFKCELIDKTWKFGLYELNYADEGCIAYTAGYVYKKQLSLISDKHKVKPFIKASLKPGIGYQYLLDHCDSILKTKKVYFNGKSVPAFDYLWRKLSEKIDIQPIKDELMILAGYSVDKLHWYFNEKYYDIIGNELDKIYHDYLQNQRKEKL